MLQISHSQINVWGSRHPAVLPGLHFTAAVTLPITPMVQSHFHRGISDHYDPLPHAFPKSKQQAMETPFSPGSCLTPGGPHCPPTAKVHGWARKPHGHLSLCKDTHGRCTMTAPGDPEERNKWEGMSQGPQAPWFHRGGVEEPRWVTSRPFWGLSTDLSYQH